MPIIEAQMKKVAEKENRRELRKVYHFKEYSTPHLILFPLMVLYWCWETLKDKFYSTIKWNPDKANKIITREIIRFGNLEEDGIISYEIRKYCHVWQRHWQWFNRPFCRKWNESLTEYFLQEYQLEGYIKEVEEGPYGDWMYVVFKKKA